MSDGNGAAGGGSNCPFFGMSGSAFPRLIPSGGNQCALFVRSLVPCCELLRGAVPDWRVCPIYSDRLVVLVTREYQGVAGG